MVECYSGLYEEGKVEHINGASGVWPSFLIIELICSNIRYVAPPWGGVSFSIKAGACVPTLAFDNEFFSCALCKEGISMARRGWVGSLICSTSPSSYNPE